MATTEQTVTLSLSTAARLLAVLDDAQQVYGDLREAGIAEPWNAAEADALDAMYAELDTLRCAAANA